MLPITTQCRPSEARRAVRSSIFLAATLYLDGSASTARIRNLSATGALVQAPAVPEVGELVQLVRGRLLVHGVVAWAAGDRFGVKFSGSIDVQRWRCEGTNAEQARVDEIVRLVKAGAMPLIPAEDGQSSSREALPDDLKLVSGLLERLADALAGDPHVVRRHGRALQNLDIATQLIAAAEQGLEAFGTLQLEDAKLAGLRRIASRAVKGV